MALDNANLQFIWNIHLFSRTLHHVFPFHEYAASTDYQTITRSAIAAESQLQCCQYANHTIDRFSSSLVK
jgi:hypothetical protein